MDAPQPTESLGDYLALIWRFRLLVLGTTMLVVVVSVLQGLREPTAYEATVTFAAAQSKIGDGGQISNTAALRPMVESLTTAAEVVREVGLDKAPYNMTPSDFLDSIAVAEVRGTNLLTVKITMADPKLAAKIANTVAEHAVQTARKVSASEASYARDLIKQELDLTVTRLSTAYASLVDYKQQAKVDAVKKDVEARLGGLQSQMTTNVYVTENAGRPGLLELLTKIPGEEARLAALEHELAVRRPADPAARLTDSVYQDLDAMAAKARSNIASLKQQRAELLGSQKLDAGTIKLLDRLYSAETELTRRDVERSVSEKLYIDLSQRYSEARLQVIGRSAEFVVIDPAVAADRPVSRHLARNAVLVAAIWLCLLVAGLLAWELSQRRRATA